MPSHIALLAIIITVKNNNLSSYGHAKYKVSEQTSHTIRFKSFFSNNSPSQFFTSGDFIINNNPNHEFDLVGVPMCISHCMISVVVSHIPKRTEEFIYFGAECTQYNSITGSSNIKMDMTILYPAQSIKFKHLGSLGCNVRVTNTYHVSGLFRFSDSGKIIIEASDIDYLKTPLLTFNAPEISFFSSSNTCSIFDIITDNINSINKDSFKKSFYIEHTANNNYGTPSSSKTLPALTVCEYGENEILLNKNKQEENNPPKKRKRGTRIVKKDKGKK
ncbi:28974_t:CDS:2, partial [Gigaspora margarita]